MLDDSVKNYINNPNKYVLKEEKGKVVAKEKGLRTWFDEARHKKKYDLTKIYQTVCRSTSLEEKDKKALIDKIIEMNPLDKKNNVETKSTSERKVKPLAKPNSITRAAKTLFLRAWDNPSIKKIHIESIQKSLSKENLALVPTKIPEIDTNDYTQENILPGVLRGIYQALTSKVYDPKGGIALSNAAKEFFQDLNFSNSIADLMINNKSKETYYLNKMGKIDKPGPGVTPFEISIESEPGSDEIKIIAKPTEYTFGPFDKNAELKLMDNTTTTVGEWFKVACSQSFVIKKEKFLKDLKAECQEKGVNAPEIRDY